MKLRNKKTGEIAEVLTESISIEILKDRENITGFYNSLSELNEEWEDAPEEPKGYWSYDTFDNEVTFNSIVNEDDRKADQEIGNYFKTREEAEKAVEKLKAWKRLKDKGFKFERWQFLDNRSGIWVRGNLVPGIVDELDILFGGEE